MEEERQPGPNIAGQLRTLRRQVDDSSIHSIEVIPTTQISRAHDPSYDVVLIHEHGKLQCISADLQTLRWTANIAPLDRSGHAVKHLPNMQVKMAVLTDARTASRGILSNRPDVISAIAPSNKRPESLAAVPLLFLLTSAPRPKSGIDRALHVFAMDSVAITTSFTANSSREVTLPSLVSWHLPNPSTSSSDQTTDPTYRFAASSASLFELSDSLSIYDLSGLVPYVRSTFHTLPNSQDLIPLSSSLLMVASDDACAVYDTKFNSIKLRFMCPIETYPGFEAQMQKAAALKNLKPGPAFVCHFADVGLTVALQRNNLVAFQLNPVQNTLKRKRGSTRLIDSIQKGVGLKSAHWSLPRKQTGQYPLTNLIPGLVHRIDDAWRSQVTELDACVEKNDVHRFEKIFLGSCPPAISKNSPNELDDDRSQPHGRPLLNGTNNNPPSVDLSPIPAIELHDRQETSSPKEPIQSELPIVDKRKAGYALGKIFALHEQQETNGMLRHHFPSRLHIKFFPRNVFHCLTASGQVTPHTIEQALSSPDHHGRPSQQFESSDVIKTIFNHDLTGRLLYTYLSQPVHLDISETLQAIRILISSTNDEQLPTPKDAHLSEALLQNGDKSIQKHASTQFSVDTNAAYEETLATAIARLYSFPSKCIVQTIQAIMTPQEIKAFITMLRQQLSEGGWLSYYIEAQLQHSKNSSSPKTPLVVITQILNCAIDAVGLSGWLVGQEIQEPSTHILSQLRAEASMVLESIHEMQSLRDILTEFSKAGPSSTLSAKIAGPNRRAGKRPSSPALPLGRSGNDNVSAMKVGAGGRVKARSKREILTELGKEVGEYSLDRIRF